MEAVILQIGATLVKGKARIMFTHAKVCSCVVDHCYGVYFHSRVKAIR